MAEENSMNSFTKIDSCYFGEYCNFFFFFSPFFFFFFFFPLRLNFDKLYLVIQKLPKIQTFTI